MDIEWELEFAGEDEKKEVAPKSYNKKIRFMLSAFAVIILVVGGGLLIRSFFISNPGILNSQSANILGENSFPELNSIYFPTLKSQKVLLENLQSPFPPVVDNNEAYFSVTTPSQKAIGTMTSNGEFKPLKNINIFAENILFLEDYSFAYFVNFLNSLNSTLFYVNSSNEVFTILELELGQKFLSVNVNVTEKQFYYIYEDLDGSLFLGNTIQNGENGIIIKNSEISTTAKIKLVTQEKIYFSDANGCFYLELQTKNFKEIECTNIPKNSKGILYTTNTNPVLEKKITAGEIYLINQQNLKQETIISEKPGTIFGNLFYSDPILYFVVYEQTVTPNGIIKSEAKKIVSYNTSEKVALTVTSVLPEGQLQTLFVIKNTLFAVTDKAGVKTVHKFVNSPLSYPISFPVSYIQLYWENINLGLTSDIVVLFEILNQSYTN